MNSLQFNNELRDVYDHIRRCLLGGESPDFYEVGQRFEQDSYWAIGRCRLLQEKGMLDWNPSQPRSFKIKREWPFVVGVICSRTGRVFGLDFFSKVE